MELKLKQLDYHCMDRDFFVTAVISNGQDELAVTENSRHSSESAVWKAIKKAVLATGIKSDEIELSDVRKKEGEVLISLDYKGRCLEGWGKDSDSIIAFGKAMVSALNQLS